MTFEELDLRIELLMAIEELGFEKAMPVQEEVIPFLMNKKGDLVALAQTGTGKTAAFGLPILNQLDETGRVVKALILSPTRELCIQIAKDMKDYSKHISGFKVVSVYGGEDIRVQLRALEREPQIIVATPGRLLDMLKRNKISLADLEYLVLDEADEMLNMGFKEEIERILEQASPERQTLLFSATMPKEIERIAKNYLTNAHEISIGRRNSVNENVQHDYYLVKAENRYLALKRVVDMNPQIYGIVFCRTRQECKMVADKLMYDGYNADALHGDLSQVQRDNVMNKFRIKNIQLLVATDVAARGLDVDDLTHVINYNLPDDPEIYTHRSGRTGRANKNGISVSIIHSREKGKIRAIEKHSNFKFDYKLIPDGLEICKKQLFAQIHKMQHVEVNEEQIDPFMEQIYNQLAYMSKEELLKRFVSLEFNRFLDYYKDSEDINYTERSNERERSDGAKRRKGRGDKVRLKINIGEDDGMSPSRILGLINRVTKDKSISVGDIEITNRYTFFDVFKDQQDQLMDAFMVRKDVVIDVAKGSRSSRGRRDDYHGGERKDDRKRGRKNRQDDISFNAENSYKRKTNNSTKRKSKNRKSES